VIIDVGRTCPSWSRCNQHHHRAQNAPRDIECTVFRSQFRYKFRSCKRCAFVLLICPICIFIIIEFFIEDCILFHLDKLLWSTRGRCLYVWKISLFWELYELECVGQNVALYTSSFYFHFFNITRKYRHLNQEWRVKIKFLAIIIFWWFCFIFIY